MKTTAAESTCGLMFPLLVGCSLIQLSGTLGTEVYGDEGGYVDLLCNPVYDDHETLYWEVVQGSTGNIIVLVKEPGRDPEVHERRYEGRLSLQGGNNLRISNLNRDDDSVDSTDPDVLGTYRCSQGTAGTQWILRVNPKTTVTATPSYRKDTLTLVKTTMTTKMSSTVRVPTSNVVQQNSSRMNPSEFPKEIAIGCAFGGLILVSVAVPMIYVWKRRNAAALEADKRGTDPALSHTGPSVQTSFLSSWEDEQNAFNSIRKPALQISDAENLWPSDEERETNPLKSRGVGNACHIILHTKEASPFVRTTQSAENQSKMSIYTHPKYLSNTGQGEDISQSLCSDGSSFSQPHTLRSSLPHSRGFRIESLADMISNSSGESQPSRGHEEETREGRVRSTGTFTEDIMRRPALPGYRDRHNNINVRALSLSERKVATTIDLMIKKRLVDRGNLGIPYHKFSDLCLQLYNTGSNWKLLAGKLGFSVGDVDVIDNCSAHHGLLAAEIVLRHWQRTAGQAGTSMIPCNLQNLQRILVDMGRKDLVEMLSY